MTKKGRLIDASCQIGADSSEFALRASNDSLTPPHLLRLIDQLEENLDRLREEAGQERRLRSRRPHPEGSR